LRGFKEDFDAWKSSLTPEEQKMVQAQAEGEFNKKFRKSDDFKQDLSEEKVKSFASILSKFFDAESADYKKELAAKKFSGMSLLEKAGGKELDFSLKNKIVEIDRDADRRYKFATMREYEYEAKGERFPESSPLLQAFEIENGDAASHEAAVAFFKGLKETLSASSAPGAKELAAAYGEVPAVGERIVFEAPAVMMNQVGWANTWLSNTMKSMKENKTDAEVQAFATGAMPEAYESVLDFIATNYVKARGEVEGDVKAMKDFYASQTDSAGKTKADVLKEIWAELPKWSGDSVPPLDEEMLAELAEEPATQEGEFKHSWGIADKLYKSEAIDAFGQKYLLGVFETQDEARKAFADWNSEYEQARADMKTEMQEWSKQENARLDKDPSGRERMKKVLEDARS